MKKTNQLIGISFILFAVTACESNQKAVITLHNPSNIDRQEVVRLSVAARKLPASDHYILQLNDASIPVEAMDKDADGVIDEFQMNVNVPADSSVQLMLKTTADQLQPEKKTQAELSIKEGGEWHDRKYEGGAFKNVSSLRVPDQHTDHSFDIRYEGPGWESDKGAYRFYLDWRNGMDFFGKMTDQVVLQGVGLDGFDSYHELSDWGMDLLKVGKTLGLGSIGCFENDTLYRFEELDSVICQVSENGLLTSSLQTTYYGWKPHGQRTTLTSDLSIEAGSALTAHALHFSDPIEGFCTGLVKNEGEVLIDKTIGAYRLLATYGDFSLNKDRMGLAIMLKAADVEQVRDGAGSHVVVFKPTTDVTYYFMAVWEKGIAPVKSAAEFEQLLNKELIRLNQPLEVTLL